MANKTYLGPRALIVSASAALLFVFAFTAFRSSSELRGQAAAPASVEQSRGRAANQPTPLTVANSSSTIELGRNIDREIDESEFAKARWGVFIMSLRDGRVLYARSADRTFAPASNMKVYTT